MALLWVRQRQVENTLELKLLDITILRHLASDPLVDFHKDILCEWIVALDLLLLFILFTCSHIILSVLCDDLLLLKLLQELIGL